MSAHYTRIHTHTHTHVHSQPMKSNHSALGQT